MRKILERAVPLITTYPLYANLLSVLQLDGARTAPWFLNHLMMMRAKLRPQAAGTNVLIDLDPGQIFNDYPFLWESPFLSVETASREQLRQCGVSVVEWIKAYILRGYYAYCYVQTSEIAAYHRTNPAATHDIFLFGFDDEQNVFYAADYFDQVYDSATVPFSEFASAFDGWSPAGNENFEELIVFSPERTAYKKDRLSYLESTVSPREYAALTVSHLEEHLGLSGRTGYMHPAFSYGLEVYGVLQSFLQAEDTVFDWYFVDSLAFLADHKTVLAELCAYYGMPAELTAQWKEQHQMITALKMRYLKHLLSGNLLPKESMSNQLEEVRNADETACREMRKLLIEKYKVHRL